MRSTLEKALEALINEDQATADQLFHDYILERSRRIHESIRQGEEVVLEDIMDDDLQEGKSFKRNKDEDADEKKKQSKEKRDSRKPVEESEDMEAGDKDESDEDESEENPEDIKEAAKGHTIEAYGVKGMKSTPWRKTFKNGDELDAWAEKNDAEVHGQRDLDQIKEGKSFKRNDDDEESADKKKQDKERKDAAKNKRKVDEEADLEEGKSFKRNKDDDADGKKKQDQQKRKDRKPVDEGKLEAVQGDDGTLTITHTPEASVEAEMPAPVGLPPVTPLPVPAPLDVPELPAPEDDMGMDDFGDDVVGDADIGMDDDLSDDEFDSLGESLAMELEKILVDTKEGDFATGGNAGQEKHSPLPNVAADKRIDQGSPVHIKSDEHNGFDREPAPTPKMPNPKFANTNAKAEDFRSQVKTDKKAMLNQTDSDKTAKSPISGK